MYLFYLDESGDPSGWSDQDNFILAGVAVHEGQVRRLSQALDDLQRRFFPSIKVPLELHAQHIHAGKGRYRSLSKRDRNHLLDSGYGIIAQAGFPNLIAFISAMHVTAVSTPSQALRDCLEDICTRFNTFLVRQFKDGYKDKGLLIMDRSGREGRVRELMAEFEQAGTRHGYLGNIMDVPYFADSAHTRMLQTADFVAFAANRYFNHRDNSYLNKILRRIDWITTRRERVGLKHIVGSGYLCDCIAIH